jgi:hypothetical protein
MNRDTALALYRPIRASVIRILEKAISACNQSDLKRAAKALGLWVDEKMVLPEGAEATEMLSDIALFEPNQRGRRAFDVFLDGDATRLDARDFELARRMGNAFFSLFHCTSSREGGGVELEDLLDGNRRLWLMDQRMEESAPLAGAFGMRLFDAGPFHVGFGIAAPTDDETAEFAIQGVRRNGRTPFRHSLAITLYGDSINGRMQFDPEMEEALYLPYATAIVSGTSTHQSARSHRASREKRTGKRK